MLDKTLPLGEALSGIHDGAVIMVGGFGMPGAPAVLLDALLERGLSDLTIVKNEANEPGMGVSKLIEAGQVSKIILSHLGLNPAVIAMMNAGKVEVEFHPQGILAEKIRCGGAGFPGFLSDIGLDTIIEDTRQVIEYRGGRVIIEPSLRADAALLHARAADRMGNLIYEKTARNFNPLMAQAADLVVAEALEVVEAGALDPDHVHTPCAFVDRIVDLRGKPSQAYELMDRHVRQA